MSSSWLFCRGVVPHRRRIPAATLGGFLIAAAFAQLAPLPVVAASEQNPYVDAIEGVLIEGVEVKGLIGRELFSSLQAGLEAFGPALGDMRLELADVFLAPEAARIVQGSPRPDDGSQAQSLSAAKDQIARAATDVESQEASMDAVRGDLQTAQGAIETAANGASTSEAVGDALRRAADTIRTSQSIATNAAVDLIATTRSDANAATSRINAAQAAAPQSQEYADEVDGALGLVEASAARQAQLVDSIEAIATRNDHASRLLYEVAADETAGAEERDLAVSAQESIAAAQVRLPQVQDLASSASSFLYDAKSNLDHARSAGSPDTMAVLNESYRNQIAEAQQVGITSTTSTVSLQELAARIADAAQAALGDLDTIDLGPLVNEQALATLESNLQALLSSAVRISVGIDAAAFEFEQAGDALSRITTDEVRLQETLLEASITSFDHLYLALFDRDALNLDSISMKLEGAVATGLELGGLVGNNVNAGVLAVDRVQSQQEGVAWETAEDAPADETTGTGATNGDDCRDETKHYDGFTVYVHYGDAGDDSCTGNDANDVFWMRAGNDYVRALRGADQLHMAGGEDEGRADEGADELWGGAHADQLFGSDGDDLIHDSEEESLDSDYLSGGPDADKCHMKDGDTNDSFFGGDGKDPEPSYDQICHIRRGCTYDYFESAGGYAVFPPEPQAA